MLDEKLRQLRIVAAHILLVGQQRGIARHHGGQRRAHAQQLDELILRGGEFLVSQRRGRSRLRLRRGPGLRGGSNRPWSRKSKVQTPQRQHETQLRIRLRLCISVSPSLIQ